QDQDDQDCREDRDPQRQIEPPPQTPDHQDQQDGEDVLEGFHCSSASSGWAIGCMRSTTFSVCLLRPIRRAINSPSENSRKNSATQMAGKPSTRPVSSLGRSGWTDSA